MKPFASVSLLLWIALPSAAVAQSFSNLSAPQEWTQGQKIFTITAASFPDAKYQVKLAPPAGEAITRDAARVDATTLNVDLATVPPSTYTLSLVSGGNTSTVGPLTVYAPDDPQISKQPSLPEITRGQQVAIQGKNFASGVVYLSTSAGNPQDGIQLPATASADKRSLTFTVPADKVQIARYMVWVRAGDKLYPVPGDLRLVADAQAPVTLDAISPITLYPTDGSGFSFEITGRNLGSPASNNSLMVVGRGLLSTGTAAECATAKTSGKYEKPCLEIEPGMETRKLRVLGFQHGKYDGPISVQVQVGNNVSNALPLTFARVSERGVLWGAVVVFLGIMAIVMRLVWKGVGDSVIGDKTYSPWYGFFLDKETNTYSLSRFQLLTWTSVFIFGYLYLFLCRMLIQWKFELPPVPDGMPGMLAISAGAAVAATGATESRGSKGAGAIHPSAADFITTGGMVVGERFQFFVWTLVGSFGFLSMLLLTDPAKLVELPKIPDSFLYVMGISSVGYLAGKVTRKPGPVIRSLVISNVGPTPAPAVNKMQMSVKLVGENLADNAVVKVGDKVLLANQYTFTDPKRQDEAPDKAFCTEVTLVLLDAEEYVEGSHTVTLTNGDGQMASASFPVDPMAIDSADFTKPKLEITVKGKNLVDVLKADWRPDAAGAPPSSTNAVTWNKGEPDKLVVTFPAELNVPGTLVLTSQAHLCASKKITAG